MKKDLIVCLVLAGLFCCCLATEDDFPVHVAQGCSISNKIYDNLHGKINEDPIKKGIVPARFPIFIGKYTTTIHFVFERCNVNNNNFCFFTRDRN